MFTALLPKGAPFFELLLEQNKILCSVARSLLNMLEGCTGVEVSHRDIASLEAEADKLHVTITRHISQTFITPIDREDILHINKAQEEAIDHLRNLGSRLCIFEFSRIRFPMLQLVRTLKDMVFLTSRMLEGLSKKSDSHNTKEFRTLRTDCEMLLSMGLVELYDRDGRAPDNVLDVIKWGQAYDRAELAVDQVGELAEAIEEAVLKNA